MNEVQLIRRELAAQREHAREVGTLLSSRDIDQNISKSNTYVTYLLLIIGLESKRAGSHLDRLRARSDVSAAERRHLEHCAREFETLSSARAAGFAPEAAAAAASRLSTVAEELEAIAESRYGVDDWRRTSHIDADSIFEERRLHKQALGEARGPAIR